MSKSCPERTMKYPYTFSAKLKQFPWKFHFEHNWVARHWVFGCIVAIPAFVKLHNIFNSPANVKTFKEAKKKEMAEIAAHHH